MGGTLEKTLNESHRTSQKYAISQKYFLLMVIHMKVIGLSMSMSFNFKIL